MTKLQSLNVNKIFKEILSDKKIEANHFTMYFSKKVKNENKNLNISFIVKKKIGSATKRNKIKRKLKAAVQKILKEEKNINLKYTYIVFAKNTAYKENFLTIMKDAKKIFNRIKN